MQQFNPLRIDHPQERWDRQKAIRPRPMGSEEAKSARAFRHPRKPRVVIADQPAIQGPSPNPVPTEPDPDRDRFAGPQVSLRVLRDVPHLVVYSAEHVDDNVFGGPVG